MESTIRFDEINLRSVIKAVWKNLWVIVLLCVSVLLCYNALSRLTYRQAYTATSTLMVSAKDQTSAYNSLTTTQSMATVFVEVFQSNVLRDKVKQQMPGGIFTGTISTTTIPETNLLVVSVTSGSPQMSFRGLGLVLENYESISEYMFSNAQLEVIKAPVIPTVPSNPQNLSSLYPLLIAVSAIVGIIAVIVLYLLRKTVQTPTAARRYIDAKLLRVVRHEEKNKTLRAKLRRKNTALLINGPLISKAFIEDNLSLCSSVEYHMRKRGQKVIMVTSVGENEGKSTIATNMALGLGQKNKKVLLLDCDFRKPSLHKILETPVEEGKAFSSYLLQEGEDAAQYLVEMPKHNITAGLSRSETKSINRLIHNGKMQKFLESARQSYDYIVVDTPPMLAAADAEAIAGMVDTAMVAVAADFMPVSVINDRVENLRKSAPEICGVVLNNY